MKQNCLSCGASLPNTPLLYLNDMPASAQNFPEKEQLKNEKTISLKLKQCKMCGLVQFDCNAVDYYKDVIRSGGFSSTMYNLRKNQYTHLINTYNLQNKKFIEIGCGGGEFLSILTEFPVKVFGIEHNSSLVDVAVSRGLNVTQNFLEKPTNILEDGPFDVFLSFNFLEHQPNPNGMLQAIYNNLTDDGMGLITVPSFEYIMEHNSFYELIRDHLAYYTFDTLRFLLEKNGFTILEQQIVNRDTISVIVKKKPMLDVSNLTRNHYDIQTQLNNYIDSKINENKTVAIWGASHQCLTLTTTAKLREKIRYIIDSAPFKQGKFTPGSHIPIISPDDAIINPVDVIIIIAPGYTNEIADIIRTKIGENIEIAVIMSKSLQMYEDIKNVNNNNDRSN